MTSMETRSRSFRKVRRRARLDGGKIKGPRRAEFERPACNAGVDERTFLKATPMGDLVIVTLEGDEPGHAFGKMMGASDAFTTWFMERAKAIDGIDLSVPGGRASPSELLSISARWPCRRSDRRPRASGRTGAARFGWAPSTSRRRRETHSRSVLGVKPLANEARRTERGNDEGSCSRSTGSSRWSGTSSGRMSWARTCTDPRCSGAFAPHSDLDVLVVSRRPTTDTEKRALIDRLLRISGRGDPSGQARSIELTIVVGRISVRGAIRRASTSSTATGGAPSSSAASSRHGRRPAPTSPP